MRRLIINADDFGLTHGVNRAVAELHSELLVTSATLMANAAATDEAIALGLRTPSLGVGCHVVLVDGEPVLPPLKIPTLADRTTGRFHSGLGSFLRRLQLGQIRAGEIEAEASAQIAVLTGRGLRLTHLDTHKHTHMFPAVLRPVLRAARAAGIYRVRNPFEPTWSRSATPSAGLIRRIEVSLLSQFEPAFRRIVAEEGFITTGGAIGVLATGTLDEQTVRALLQSIPPGTWEMVTHPGYNDQDLAEAHTRLLASREGERAALRVMQPECELELISFAQLAEDGTGP